MDCFVASLRTRPLSIKGMVNRARPWFQKWRMTSRNFGHRAPLLWLVVPFVAGLAVGKLGDFAPVPWLLAGALGGGVVALWASVRAPRWWGGTLAASMLLA